jgi:hypothetical protein
MFRAVLVVGYVFAAACGGGGGAGGGGATVDAPGTADAPIAQVCIDAESHSDLTWIQANIFTKQCVFSGCHDGGTGAAGKMDLRPGHAIASLVGSAADLCSGTDIVVAGHPEQSYLMVMLGQVEPTAQTPPECAIDPMIGEMPQSSPTVLLCPQKRDAIQRWITAGAMND